MIPAVADDGTDVERVCDSLRRSVPVRLPFGTVLCAAGDDLRIDRPITRRGRTMTTMPLTIESVAAAIEHDRSICALIDTVAAPVAAPDDRIEPIP